MEFGPIPPAGAEHGRASARAQACEPGGLIV